MDTELFNGMDFSPLAPQSAVPAPPRVESPDRRQVLLVPCSLEYLLPPDHEVRTLWAVVEKLDLAAFYAPLKARGEAPGRSAKDPRLLVALWLWACTQGEGSARQVAINCHENDTYRWLCGGVEVNHHTLSDFRADHGQALDDLFTQVLALLMSKQLVKVHRISQDGLRVRAAAGATSFKRQERLEEALAKARAQVEALKRQVDAPAKTAGKSRQEAARLRGAEDRQKRVAEALAQLPKIQEIKNRQSGHKRDQTPRVSTTDPEARKMKMADGGFRPAYNVQLAADTQSRAIVAVEVSNIGSDQPLSEPVRHQVQARTGEKVAEHLLDGGFVNLENIERANREGVTMYLPPKATKAHPDPYLPQPTDSEPIQQWRARMGTPEGKTIYKLRASTSETVNADLRTYRGLNRFLVRGLRKARCVALWSALAYNLMHFGKDLLA